MEIDTNIFQKLTSDEKELFSIISEVIKKYTPSTQAFVAGGWVRDRLLGKKSEDIDIMLSNISGEEFAKLLTSYLNIKDAHTIQANPEKSKNITTAKAYIPLSSGKIQEVDFAQARSEVYKEDSRIPDIKPATPEEDAMRRDLTLNSIFFRISPPPYELKDFTGMGIKDLISNTIRTPQNPLKTFSDDPLRVFRVCRFYAKLNGNIDPETLQAMKDPSLREEIKQKVSKERIGQEFLKMMKTPNPDKAIQLLYDTGLFQDIISEAIKGTEYEGKMDPLYMSQNNTWHKLSVWEHTMEVVKNIMETYSDAEPEKRTVMILAALMHDLGKTCKKIQGESKSHPGSTSYIGHDLESTKLLKLIFKYLKIEPYINEISKLVFHHMRLHTLHNNAGQKALRKFIREMGEISVDWMDMFNMAIADAYAKDVVQDPEIGQQYQALKSKLEEAVHSISDPQTKNQNFKPILNGEEIMKALNIKSGPHIKTMIDFLKDLRDENPNITKEEATVLLKQKFIAETKQFQIQTPMEKPMETPIEKQAQTETSEEKTEKKGVCPVHLLESKIEEINQLFKEEKYYEIITTLNELKNYDDEYINNLIAKSLFKLLTLNQNINDLELVRYITKKANENFFDSTLCNYVLGILLTIKSKIDKKSIEIIAKRMKKMNPKLLNTIIENIPDNAYNKEIIEKIKNNII